MKIKSKIERILLISPHYTFLKNHYKNLVPPLGVAYIAAVLEKERYNVKILDVAAEGFNNEIPVGKNSIKCGLSYNEIKKRIRNFNPHIVGVSCLLSSQFDSSQEICKIAKDINKNIITIIGGEHPSALPEESLKNQHIDIIIIGEGEYSVLKLINYIESGKDISKLDGIAFKKGEKIIVNPKKRFINNLDEIPFPARHLLPMEKYFKIGLPQGIAYLRTPNTSIITSRGCSANCIFCATTRFWGNNYRARSAENVLTEIEYLINTYGIKELQFIDDNLTLDKERAIEIFRGIKKRFDISWTTPNGLASWTLDEELLREMKESGCYEATIAIESGDQGVLNKIIGKPGNLGKIKRLIKEMKKLKIMTKAFFVIGLPGETKKQILKTFKFASELNLDSASFFLATPLPGTRLLKICEEKDYLRGKINYNDFDQNIANIETPEFSAKELERILFRNMLIFNLKLLIRDPITFIKKYHLVLLKNPKMIFKYTFTLMRKL